jgi:hypothetical protein
MVCVIMPLEYINLQAMQLLCDPLEYVGSHLAFTLSVDKHQHKSKLRRQYKCFFVLVY